MILIIDRILYFEIPASRVKVVYTLISVPFTNSLLLHCFSSTCYLFCCQQVLSFKGTTAQFVWTIHAEISLDVFKCEWVVKPNYVQRAAALWQVIIFMWRSVRSGSSPTMTGFVGGSRGSRLRYGKANWFTWEIKSGKKACRRSVFTFFSYSWRCFFFQWLQLWNFELKSV